MRGILSIAAAGTLLAMLGTAPVQAQTVGYGEAIGAMTAVCSADLERNCKGVKPGAGALRACLVNNQANVSSDCLKTVEVALALLAERAAAQEAVPQICANDARRRCSEFQEGRARVLRCLIRPDVARSVSKKCRQALTDAGWD